MAATEEPGTATPADGGDDGWTLAELLASGEGDVNARTVRFWIKEGLLPAPSGGRGAHARYGRRHLARIAEIRRLQALGLSLANIALLVNAPPPSRNGSEVAAIAAGSFWARRPAAPEWSLALGPGVRLVVDAGTVGPLDPAQQAELLRSAGPLLATLAALAAAQSSSRKV